MPQGKTPPKKNHTPNSLKFNMNKEHEGIPASPLSSATASTGLLLHQQNTVVLGLSGPQQNNQGTP